MFLIAILTASCCLLILVLQRTQRESDDNHSRIPAAHWSAQYSSLWLLSVRWRQCENQTRLQLHRKLGPIMRVSPFELSINCMDEGVRAVYGSEFLKSPWYGYVFNGDECVVPRLVEHSTSGKTEHSARRKLLSGVYTKSAVLNSSTIDDCTTHMLGQLQNKLSVWVDGPAVDVFLQAKACLMDVTTAWLYGAENATDFLNDTSARDDFLTNFTHSFNGAFWRTEFPWLFKATQSLGARFNIHNALSSRRHVEAWGSNMASRALASRPSSPSAPPNITNHFLSSLSRASSKPDTGPAAHDSLTTVSAEMLDHIVASNDVASIAIAYTILELSRHPAAQRALRAELRDISGPGTQTSAQRVEDLPILDAVLTETLRLRSPNPGPWPRVVPGGIECRLAGGYVVPAGTVVSATSWALHRSEDVFPDPESWRPERWLEAGEVERREMKKWFWAFGSGARMCLGLHFGMRVMKAILVAIYMDHETTVGVNGELEQIDGVVAGPVSGEVKINFRRCVDQA